jgi:hypothetical protein
MSVSRRNRPPTATHRSSANAPQRAVTSAVAAIRAERTEINDVAEPYSRWSWMTASRPHSPAFNAHHDASLIDERAATRGRRATKGGNEHAGVKRRHSFERPALVVSHRNARGERRDRGRARSLMAYRRAQDGTPVGGTWAVPLIAHQRCAAHRRTRRNARAQRNGRLR